MSEGDPEGGGNADDNQPYQPAYEVRCPVQFLWEHEETLATCVGRLSSAALTGRGGRKLERGYHDRKRMDRERWPGRLDGPSEDERPVGEYPAENDGCIGKHARIAAHM